MAIKLVLGEDPKQYLELWKWFQEDAGKIKDKMWTIATFFYTVFGTVLGYIGKQYAEQGHLPYYLVIATSIGCFLSLYGMYLIHAYGSHIRSSWNRADYLLTKVEGLSDIWDSGLSPSSKYNFKLPFFKKVPQVAKRLIYLMFFFLLLFSILTLAILI